MTAMTAYSSKGKQKERVIGGASHTLREERVPHFSLSAVMLSLTQ